MRNLSFSFLLLLAMGTTAPAVQFTIPDATQSVSPGGRIGFSFTLTSEEMLDPYGDPFTPWLLLNYAIWVPDAGVAYPGPFLGFLGLNSEVVGPDTGNGEVNPFSQTYNSSLGTGVGEMIVNPS